MLGEVSATRRLYLAFKRRHDVDLTCPLPMLHPAETVVSCGRADRAWRRGILEPCLRPRPSVQKQTTGTLAAREAGVLERLHDAAVPRVANVASSRDSSTVTLEKIDGWPFDEAIGEIAESEVSFPAFVAAALDLLEALRAARIEHRDIHADNLLIRDGRPVLLDFGWATAPGLPVFTPEELLRARNRIGETSVGERVNGSDVQAMGALLLDVCPPTSPVRGLLAVMAHDDPRLRLENLTLLRALLADLQVAPIAALLSHIESRDRAIEELRKSVTIAAQKSEADRQALSGTELELAHAERTLARRASAEDVAELQARLVATPSFTLDAHGPPIEPPLRPYALAYASALRRHGQPAAALALTLHIMQRIAQDDDLESWLVGTYLCASIRRELGRADEAFEDFEQILACDPARVPATFLGGALFHSALILEAQGSTEDARHRLTRCLETLPEHSAARAALARLG